ncbi:hypothetical protein MC885_019843 [Smutsia gigantea]|nr:hypothetical protein MC885_019843 [Smutsia gigantea]
MNSFGCMRPIGHDGYHPTSVAEWLDSIELGDHTKAFLINGYTSMDLLKKIWEVELINVWTWIHASPSGVGSLEIPVQSPWPGFVDSCKYFGTGMPEGPRFNAKAQRLILYQ